MPKSFGKLFSHVGVSYIYITDRLPPFAVSLLLHAQMAKVTCLMILTNCFLLINKVLNQPMLLLGLCAL